MPPTSPPDPLDHARALGSVAYRATVLVHLWLVALFAWFDVGVLTGFHALAAFVSAGLLAVHARGGVTRAFVGSLALAGVQVALATWTIGWDTGYHLFLLPACVIAGLSPGVPARRRALIFAGAVAGYVGAFLLLAGHPPTHTLPAWVVRAMWGTNLAGALGFVALWGQGLVQRMLDAEARAAAEHARSEALLANMLPTRIAARLKAGEHVSEAHAEVSVVFADLAGFTVLAGRLPPAELVTLLDGLFSQVDALAERHGVQKIKTIGDAYMAAAGIPEACPDPAVRAVAFALDLLDALAPLADGPHALRVRVGVATGPVVAGVIGARTLAYDVWGDTVNTAARMESHGEPGRLHVDAATRARIGDAWPLIERGELDVKGKGRMRTWFVERPRD